MKGISGDQVLRELAVAPDPFAEHLVTAAEQHRAEADERIGRASEGWPLDRMAVVDRLVMRLAVSELLDPTGPSVAVVIDEAVELAKTYSTDESGGFVNGILSSVASDVRTAGSGRRDEPLPDEQPDARAAQRHGAEDGGAKFGS
jgi:N utilization substance protein B